VSGTGWTWQHVRHECDLPTYLALCDWWREVPPPAVQLRRIASFIGMKPGAQPGTPRMASGAAAGVPSRPEEVAAAAAQVGIRAFEGRPADPMLDLIPPPPDLQPSLPPSDPP
jgi:hypothetical protein